ncbi:hypothetical protein EDD17DRAFT_1524910 [Pisolithus thermaeus]|nr:hypothetical protein EDD17DRAFT_1524910 [Pisolithus thermaeus]
MYSFCSFWVLLRLGTTMRSRVFMQEFRKVHPVTSRSSKSLAIDRFCFQLCLQANKYGDLTKWKQRPVYYLHNCPAVTWRNTDVELTMEKQQLKPSQRHVHRVCKTCTCMFLEAMSVLDLEMTTPFSATTLLYSRFGCCTRSNVLNGYPRRAIICTAQVYLST